MNTRLHRLGLIPIIRGIQGATLIFSLFLIFHVQERLRLPEPVGFVGMLVLIFAQFPVMGAYHHGNNLTEISLKGFPNPRKNTPCMSAYMGQRRINFINQEHLCGC